MKSLLACSIIATFWLGTTARADPIVSAAANEIDALLAKDWAANNVTPNAPADDSLFVRRIYLDVVGRIPNTREAEEFLASKENGRRTALIDKLLDSEGYVQNYFHYWADVLRVQSKGQRTGPAYVHFIKDALRRNKPYVVFVREMARPGPMGRLATTPVIVACPWITWRARCASSWAPASNAPSATITPSTSGPRGCASSSRKV